LIKERNVIVNASAEPNWPEVLSAVFTDPRFRWSGYRSSGEVDGVRIGVVLATMNSNFNTFALNKGDLDRLTEAKRRGKIDVGFVVGARAEKSSERSYQGSMAVDDVVERLRHEPTRSGRLGEFYVLPASFFPLDDYVVF
jgi:hypothetical protein